MLYTSYVFIYIYIYHMYIYICYPLSQDPPFQMNTPTRITYTQLKVSFQTVEKSRQK